MILGVDTGNALNEVAVSATEWPGFKERLARRREWIKLIHLLWREDRVTLRVSTTGPPRRRSTTDPTTRCRSTPQPAGRSSRGSRSREGRIDLHQRQGDGPVHPQAATAVREGLAKAGREHTSFDRTIEIKPSYDVDPGQAAANTRFWAPLATRSALRRLRRPWAGSTRSPPETPNALWRRVTTYRRTLGDRRRPMCA